MTDEYKDTGEDLTVSYEVTNGGSSSDTQDINLTIEEQGTGTETTVDTDADVTLSSGGTTTGTLTWDTSTSPSPGGEADYDARVRSDDDFEVRVVKVLNSPPNFTASITSTNSPVDEGNTLDVSADITNSGSDQWAKDVWLEIDGTEKDRIADLELGGGNTGSVTLSWSTSSGDAGDYTAKVASEDDSDTASVTIDAPAISGDTILSGDLGGEYHAIDDSDGTAFYSGSDSGSVGGVETFQAFDFWYTGEGDGDLYKRNTSDGSVANSNLGALGNAANNSTSDSDFLYFRDSNAIWKVDPSNLSVSWQSSLALSNGQPEVTTDGNYLYAVDGSTIYKLNIANGSTDTSNNIASGDLRGVSIGDNGLYAGGGDFSGAASELFKIDSSDLSVIWSNANNSAMSIDQSASSVYIGKVGGDLQKIDQSDGSTIWSLNLAQAQIIRASADDETVYFADEDALVKKIDTATQSVVWTYDMNSFSMFMGLAIGGTI